MHFATLACQVRKLLKTRSLIERRRAGDVGRACRRPADARILASVKSWLGSSVYQSVASCLKPKLESLSNFVCFAGRPSHYNETYPKKSGRRESF